MQQKYHEKEYKTNAYSHIEYKNTIGEIDIAYIIEEEIAHTKTKNKIK